MCLAHGAIITVDLRQVPYVLMGRVVAALVVSGAGPFVAHAQLARERPVFGTDSPIIGGRVVADISGDPLPNTRVEINPGAGHARVVLTDEAGHFVFVPERPGRYSLSAAKSGYARAHVSALRALRMLRFGCRAVRQFSAASSTSLVTPCPWFV